MTPRPKVPTLTDGVVTLRRHRDDDIDRCVEQSLDPASIRWTTVPTPYSREDAKRFLREVMPGGWETDQEWGFAVEHEGRYAGTVSLRNEGQGRAEIAYGSHPAVRGTGAMERALRLLLEWGFSPVGSGGRDLKTVIWYAYVGNWASRRLAWKVGFDCTGTLRGWLDHRGELRDVWAGTLQRGDALQPRTDWLDVPRIVGENVVLRQHRPDDLDRVVEGCSDARTAYWLGQMQQPYTREHAAEFLCRRSEGMAAGSDLHWMLADPVDDRCLGTISLMHLRWGTAEIGYWAHPEARGRGVMTEAVRLVARHAFIDRADGGLGLHRVHLEAAVDNVASRHVAEVAGFTQEGVRSQSCLVRDGMHDGVIYALLKAPGAPT